jgi:hypothetical protein
MFMSSGLRICAPGTCYRETLPNLDWLLEGLPPGVCFSDVDAMLERRGRLLAIEYKRENERLSTGQRIMLETLARQHTVWYMRETDSPDLFDNINLGVDRQPTRSSKRLMRRSLHEWWRGC